MTYPKTLEYLFQLQKRGMKPGLGNMKALLSSLGDPHEKVRFVHVGGTNGKGSTCSLLASILREAGYRVGLYTSPHLIEFTERITVNGVQVSREETVLLAGRVASAMSETPSFFEFTTAMAFLYFLQKKVDIAVVEVGLGGRLDSTNLIEPLLSIITNVDLDHQDILGQTLLEIAREKAGIIKSGVPVITGVVQPEVLRLVGDTARKAGTIDFAYERDFKSIILPPEAEETRFEYHGMAGPVSTFSTPLLGAHQVANASLALAAAELLGEKGFPVSRDHIRRGLANVSWPGRLEIVQRDPLIFLDGAHNPAGARVLAGFLKNLKISGKKRLVLGIMKDKAIYEIGEALFPWADEIILTQSLFPRAASPLEMVRALPPTEKPIFRNDSVSETVQFIKNHALPGDVVCFTGSLYTIGEVKAIFEGSPIYLPLHG